MTETIRLSLTERAAPEHYADGVEYHVAQIDFRGERRARLYATCEVRGRDSLACFARDGFWVLGPLPAGGPAFDPQVFSASFQAKLPPVRMHTVPWGQSLQWGHLPADAVSFLDPDIIPTTARAETIAFYRWHSSGHFPFTEISFILHGSVVSPDERRVRAVFSRIGMRLLLLNGDRVEGETLPLRRGRNELRIQYAPPMLSEAQFGERNYGCYFCLTDASGGRLTDIRFERPSRPGF